MLAAMIHSELCNAVLLGLQLKENTCGNGFVVDKDDSSLTR